MGPWVKGAGVIQRLSTLVLFTAALALFGCQEDTTHSASNSSANQPKTNQVETGRFALQKMLPAAHLWSPDAAPVLLSSSNSSEGEGREGKSIFWRAVFASRARQKAQPFTWSGAAADAARRVDHGVEDTFNPNNRTTQPWDLNFLKADTDQAFATAQQHGGKTFIEKNPKASVSYLLDFDVLSSQLRWHVIYSSESAGKLTVLVDASTGQFVRKE
jgi:hypothetical protein